MINIIKKENDNSLITSITISKKDLEKIIELESDIPNSLIELMENNKNLDTIEIYDLDAISFIYQLNWILDDYHYINLSETELEIAIKVVNNRILELREKVNVFSKDKETLIVLKNELNKYKYMLSELRKLLVLRRKEPPKRI